MSQQTWVRVPAQLELTSHVTLASPACWGNKPTHLMWPWWNSKVTKPGRHPAHGPALRGCLLRLMFDNTKPIFPMTFSHLRQERSPSSRQRTYSTVINTQAFKNICDQKGLCFLISLQSRGGLRVRDRGKGKGERGRGRKGARNGGYFRYSRR